MAASQTGLHKMVPFSCTQALISETPKMPKYYDDLDRSHYTSWGYGKYEAWEYEEDEPDPQLEFMYGHFPDHIKRSSDIYRRWLNENDINPEEALKHQTSKTAETLDVKTVQTRTSEGNRTTVETKTLTSKPTPPDHPPRPPLEWLEECGMLKRIHKLMLTCQRRKEKKEVI